MIFIYSSSILHPFSFFQVPGLWPTSSGPSSRRLAKLAALSLICSVVSQDDVGVVVVVFCCCFSFSLEYSFSKNTRSFHSFQHKALQLQQLLLAYALFTLIPAQSSSITTAAPRTRALYTRFSTKLFNYTSCCPHTRSLHSFHHKALQLQQLLFAYALISQSLAAHLSTSPLLPLFFLLYVAPAVPSALDSRHYRSPYSPLLRSLLRSRPPRPPPLPENFGCWQAHRLRLAHVSCDGERRGAAIGEGSAHSSRHQAHSSYSMFRQGILVLRH